MLVPSLVAVTLKRGLLRCSATLHSAFLCLQQHQKVSRSLPLDHFLFCSLTPFLWQFHSSLSQRGYLEKWVEEGYLQRRYNDCSMSTARLNSALVEHHQQPFPCSMCSPNHLHQVQAPENRARLGWLPKTGFPMAVDDGLCSSYHHCQLPALQLLPGSLHSHTGEAGLAFISPGELFRSLH